MEDVSCILRLHLLFYNVLLVSNRWMCGGIVESTISGALLSDRGTGHWAYKSYDVTTPLTTQTVSPRGSRSPCPDQKGILGKDYLCVVGRLVPEAGLAVVCC